MWDFGYNEEAMVNLLDSVPGIRLLDRKTSGWHKGNVQYQKAGQRR